MSRRYADFSSATSTKLPLYQRYTLLDSANNQNPAKISPFDFSKKISQLDQASRQRILSRSRSIADQINSDFNVYTQVIKSDNEQIARHYVVWYRKYTFSLACLLLFFVGAPFGSIVRKGGLGMPLVTSVLFFVLYYVIDMIDEKAVRGGALDEHGMWIATIVFIPIGLLLTLYATTDSSPNNSRWFVKFFSLLSRYKK